MKNRLSALWMKVRLAWLRLRAKFAFFVRKRPFSTFLSLLILLFVIVAVGHQLRKPPTVTETPQLPVKEVDLFSVGAVPHIKLQAKIEKSGVITIVAQSSGILQKIRVKEGDHVKRGSQLFAFSTNYQGGNAADLARQINQRNYQFLVDNYDTQKDELNKKRQIAQTTEAKESQLRSITRQSLDETTSLINLDQAILDGLNKQINQLQALNVNGASDSAILQVQQAAAGTTASLNTARATLRSNQYQSDESKEPAQLSTLDRDLALVQLDLQARMLDLNKDLSKLNLRISQVNEALMFPAAPFAGTVERIFVKVGQSVTPGTPLAEMRGDINTASAVILTSADIADTVSRFEPTVFTTHGSSISALPRSISEEPTDGNLHSLIFTLPEEYAVNLTNGSYIPAEVPVGVNYVKANDPFVPLDAVYQTQDSAYVLIAQPQGDKLVARSQQVKIDQVFGNYINVIEGIKPGDRIILNRNVIEGDVVRAK